MLDYCAEYHHQYGAFLCVRVHVQNLGEPGPVVTSFAKRPGYGHPFISDGKFNVTVNPQFHQVKRLLSSLSLFEGRTWYP
jgi:hypothetical protein